MFKKALYIIFAIAVTKVFADVASNSAPTSSTGAPGEVNCTTSGCHQSYTVNSGSGNVILSVDSGITNYEPGKTYTITAEINQGSLNRFGYELVALADIDSSNAGVFSITDFSRTQTLPGTGVFSGRKYMTYTFNGTNAVSTGKGKWSFKWTAPNNNVGPITLYLATIAANNDGYDLGDYCYTTSLKLFPTPAGISTLVESNSEFKIFPNPVNDKINIFYKLAATSEIKIDLFNSNGKKLESLFSSQQQEGDYNITIKLSKEYSTGVYLIGFNQNSKIKFTKILIEN